MEIYSCELYIDFMRTFKLISAPVLVGALTVSAMGYAPSVGATTIHQSTTSVAAHAVKPKIVKVVFKGTYKGTIAMLWSSTGVKATAVTGTGTGTYLGSSKLSGSGSAPASNTCDPLTGTGTLVGAGSKLVLKIIAPATSQACAAGQSAPTSVSVKGIAKVISGSGKYKGVFGTLKFTGSFSIKSTTAGSSESDAFTAALNGVLSIKK